MRGARAARSGPKPSSQPADFRPPPPPLPPSPSPSPSLRVPSSRLGSLAGLNPPYSWATSWAHALAGELTWMRGSGIPV